MDNRHRTTSSLAQDVSSVSGKSISAQTVHQSLNQCGLHGHISRKKPLFTTRKPLGSTSYLSPSVQNAFIHILAVSVKNSLFRCIQKACYYALMIDTNPDQAQMSQVMQYVNIDFEKMAVCVSESFLSFSQISQKDATGLVKIRCYDNAAVMARNIIGVQHRIKELNSKILSVNCDNHPLNLIGLNAAKSDIPVILFFNVIDLLFAFFSQSTRLWEKLKHAIPLVLRSPSDTRWSARTDAVKTVVNFLNEHLMDNGDETADTFCDAVNLLNRILMFNFLELIGFWNWVLARINRIQQWLQDPEINF
uniref:Transposase Tc1-like domain-containing protein n=1 Tax=Octopus bimaculoides TaxID=37653 RepID=A0A0L8I7H5_OCTBM